MYPSESITKGLSERLSNKLTVTEDHLHSVKEFSYVKLSHLKADSRTHSLAHSSILIPFRFLIEIAKFFSVSFKLKSASKEAIKNCLKKEALFRENRYLSLKRLSYKENNYLIQAVLN